MRTLSLGRDRRNVLLLAVAQALFMSSGIIGIAFGGLVGFLLVDDKAWATLPIAATVVGAAVATIPASFIMKRLGRRNGFLLGTAACIASGVLGVYAIYAGSMALFCCAHFLQGVHRAFAQYFRFAATDVSPPAFHGRAISYVLAGGVVAAVAGPQLGIWSKDLLAPLTFAGAYAVIAALGVLSLLPLALVEIPRPRAAELSGPSRPLSAILADPVVLAALLSGSVGFAVMSLVMTATPLSMVACAFPVATATWVIQWHVLGMFVPSFFTGALIARIGLYNVIYAGLLLFAGSIVAAVSGIAITNFTTALVLLGVGWNFLFVGGSTLLTRTYRPAERAKVQALNEFAVALGAVVASVSAGGLLSWSGWDAVSLSAIPALAATLIVTLWAQAAERRRAAPA